MEDALRAYDTGRADGMAARRDATRAADPATGADYRIGFLDGRIEVFHLHAQTRRLLEDED
ncbi:MAG: hypothetical protein ABW046_04900 [Actinoplanes sp.]